MTTSTGTKLSNPSRRPSTARLALALPMCALLAACASHSSSELPVQTIDPANILCVQVFNYGSEPADLQVSAHPLNDPSRAPLTFHSFEVPTQRRNVDPSLGGDPQAIAEVAYPLAPGTYELRIRDLRRGQEVRQAFIAPAPPHFWLTIVRTDSSLTAHTDLGFRALE